MKRGNQVVLATALLTGIAVGVAAWIWLVPAARKIEVKHALSISLSQPERAQLEVARYLPPGSKPLFTELTAKSKVVCGKVSLRGSNSNYGPLERFVFVPGFYIRVGKRDLIPLSAEAERFVAFTQANERVLGLRSYQLFKDWQEQCDDSIPVAELYAEEREIIRQSMKDPGSAVFRNETVGVGGKYCGEVNAKNSYGAYAGFSRFYVLPGEMWQIEGSKPVAIAATHAYWASVSHEAVFAVFYLGCGG